MFIHLYHFLIMVLTAKLQPVYIKHFGENEKLLIIC